MKISYLYIGLIFAVLFDLFAYLINYTINVSGNTGLLSYGIFYIIMGLYLAYKYFNEYRAIIITGSITIIAVIFIDTIIAFFWGATLNNWIKSLTIVYIPQITLTIISLFIGAVLGKLIFRNRGVIR